METIGYCGLGHMGGAIARSLGACAPLTVFDLDREKMTALAGIGCRTASSPAALAKACDIVILCLPTWQHVERALFAGDGIARHMQAGSLLVDQTSGDPEATLAMAERLRENGVALVDAPVSGGPAAAAAGKLVVMAGGDGADISRVERLFKAMTENFFHVGPTGAGHALKIANNLITAAQRLVTLEALSLAVSRGVDRNLAVEVLSKGSARNYTIEYTLPSHVLNGRLFQGCTLETMYKDIVMARKMGQATTLPMPFAEEAGRAYLAMMKEHGRDTEVNAMALTYERLAGIRLTPDGRSLDP